MREGLRADHVAGAFFIAVGVLIFAMSGDLPVGRLSMPGSGFLPRIVAGLLILMGVALALRAHESPLFARVGWDDLPHAIKVAAITVAATALYLTLGFVTAMVLMMLALMILHERIAFHRAALYSIGVVGVTYAVFVYVLKTPMPTGPLGF